MTRTLSYGNLRRYAIFLPLGGQQYSQFSVVTNFNLVSFQLSICKQAVLCKQKIDKTRLTCFVLIGCSTGSVASASSGMFRTADDRRPIVGDS